MNLIIKTKCPTKWIIEDLETGQRYRANGKEEIGKMFTLIDKLSKTELKSGSKLSYIPEPLG